MNIIFKKPTGKSITGCILIQTLKNGAHRMPPGLAPPSIIWTGKCRLHWSCSGPMIDLLSMVTFTSGRSVILACKPNSGPPMARNMVFQWAAMDEYLLICYGAFPGEARLPWGIASSWTWSKCGNETFQQSETVAVPWAIHASVNDFFLVLYQSN